MPELAEVARIVHFLRANLRNQTLTSVTYPKEDPIIFQTPKTGLTIESFAAQLEGRTVVDAQQQGKYFWLVMDKPPHPLMHFGMTGWIRFRGTKGAGVDYRRMQDDSARAELNSADVDAAKLGVVAQDEEWPPRFWKFNFVTASTEASFIDARRLGRVRLIDCPASEIRTVSPLKENGPDPIADPERFTPAFLAELTSRRRVPIKSLLLDQAAISGIGNWLADEVLYQARIHPAVYAPELSEKQVKTLYEQIVTVCGTAVDLLADSERFPSHWLMRWRWDKGKKEASRLPDGERIVHVEVGGRTSAVVPSRQKKTGAADVDDEEDDGAENEDSVKKETPKTKAAEGRKRASRTKEEDDPEIAGPKPSKRKKSNPSAKPKDLTNRKKESATLEREGVRRSSRRKSGD